VTRQSDNHRSQWAYGIAARLEWQFQILLNSKPKAAGALPTLRSLGLVQLNLQHTRGSVRAVHRGHNYIGFPTTQL
jgi:hypothetical protein